MFTSCSRARKPHSTSFSLICRSIIVPFCFRTIMTLITHQIPTALQSIKHFLETTLFLTQSNWSQSKINPAINVPRVLRFQRSQVCPTLHWTQLHLWLFTLKQSDREASSAEKDKKPGGHKHPTSETQSTSYCLP